MEFGDKFNTEMTAPGKENADIENFADIGSKSLVFGDEFFRTVNG